MEKQEIANLVLSSITEDPCTPTAWKTYTEEIGRTGSYTTTGYSWTFGDPSTVHGFIVYCQLLPYQQTISHGTCQLTVRAKDLSVGYQGKHLTLDCPGSYTLRFAVPCDDSPVAIQGILRLVEDGLQVAMS